MKTGVLPAWKTPAAAAFLLAAAIAVGWPGWIAETAEAGRVASAAWFWQKAGAVAGTAAPFDRSDARGPFRSADPDGGGNTRRNHAALLALGRDLAVRGMPARGIGACESCHGAAVRATVPLYTYLAGQPTWYLSTKLRLWKTNKRLETPAARLMNAAAARMTDDEIEAAALWYAAQPVSR